MEDKYLDFTTTYQEISKNINCGEEIKIKCVPDESRNIIEVHELQEKHSSMIVLELPAKFIESECENIVINGEEENKTNLFESASDTFKYMKIQEKIIEDRNEHYEHYQCFHCGFKSQNLSRIQKHYNVHTLSKPFEKRKIGYECVSSNKILHSCEACDFKSLTVRTLKEHIWKYHQDLPPFICPECNFLTNMRSSLDEHLLLHVKTIFFKCYFCSFRCTKKRYLKMHLKLMHSNYKPFECKKCNFTCKRRIDLLKHDKKHSIHKPYKCEQCSFSSKSLQYLKTHMLSHKNMKPFHCAVCDRNFTTKYLLKDHFINYHTHEKPFECSLCLISFKRNSSLKRHLLTHTEYRPFECSFCDYSCSRKDNLKSHVNAIHSDIKPFNCSFCSFSCKFKATLKSHMSVHSLSNSYVCNKCGYRFNSDIKLKRHASSHTLRKWINCPYCSFTTKTKIDIQLHLQSCRKNSRIFSCSECDFSSRRRSILNKHLEQQHSDPTLPFHCPRCSLKFKLESYYNLHIQSHDSSESFCCSHCLFNTKVKEILVKHISYHDLNWRCDTNKTCHLNILINGNDSNVLPQVEIEADDDCKLDVEDMKIFKINFSETEGELGKVENITSVSAFQNLLSNPNSDDDQTSSAAIYHPEQFDTIQKMPTKHKCSVCEKTFRTKFDLKDHLTLQHTEYRQYKCDQCEQRFKLKANLKQHLVVHSDAKPYQCTICDYKSKLPETLRRHYVTHSTEKPFQCPLCKYRCKLKEKLKRHMIIHSADRPFHCSECDYTCKSKELLKKHAVVHTRDNFKSLK